MPNTKFIILHGENIVKSREELNQTITQAKQNNTQVVRLEGYKLTPAQLELALHAQSLFTPNQLVVIEKIWSHKSLAIKKQLLNMVVNSPNDCLLWHHTSLTSSQLKLFPKNQSIIKEFKPTKYAFLLTELWGTTAPNKLLTLLKESITQDSAEFVLIMIINQIRNLFLLSHGEVPKTHPYVLTKMQSQLKKIPAEKITNWHAQLVSYDRALKTSTSTLNIEQFLTLLIVKN